MTVRKPVPKTERSPTGPYATDGATHATAFPAFVEHVNALLARETQTYISETAVPAPTPTASDAGEPSG